MGEVPPRHQRLIQDARDANTRLVLAERALQAALNEMHSAAAEEANAVRRLINSQALLNRTPPKMAKAQAALHLYKRLRAKDSGWPGGPERFENVRDAIQRKALLNVVE